jgi:hypothetical protein
VGEWEADGARHGDDVELARELAVTTVVGATGAPAELRERIGGALQTTSPEDIAFSPTSGAYAGIAAAPLSERAQAVLQKYQIVPDDWIDIKPNGQLYLSNMRLRSIFHEAFQFGGWALAPVQANFTPVRVDKTDRYGKAYQHVTLYREYRFYAEGRFQRQMMGAGDYLTNNADANYSDAAEGCESYALNRAGKFFGIASQCWDKAYAEWWKSQFAFKSGDVWKKKAAANKLDPKTATGVANVNPPTEAKRNAGAGPTANPPADTPRADDVAPVSGSTRNETAVIQVGSFGKSWKHGQTPCLMVKDMDGGTWSFRGADVIAVAESAMDNKRRVLIEYLTVGKYRNVVDAQFMDGDE